ncbi:hypothetical protein V6N13_107233 [Hibiscus sabdariffa]
MAFVSGKLREIMGVIPRVTVRMFEEEFKVVVSEVVVVVFCNEKRGLERGRPRLTDAPETCQGFNMKPVENLKHQHLWYITSSSFAQTLHLPSLPA